MAVKNTAQVVIGGKIITLGGYESEEYFQKVASYINNKIAELSEMPGYTRQPVETKHTLLSLKDLQQKDQEMYELKHELIALRMKIEETEKNAQEAQQQKELLEGKVKELNDEIDKLLK